MKEKTIPIYEKRKKLGRIKRSEKRTVVKKIEKEQKLNYR